MGSLRIFKLFRVVYMGKGFQGMKLLLDSISHTISAISNFSILLSLFIYVYSLLGMEFFAGKLLFD